jgi:polygalacturonase
MRLFCYVPSLAVVFFAGISGVQSQDARHVVEPHIPRACVVLQARLAAVDGVLPSDAEQDLDTARIQQAIDQCDAGKAVELRANGNAQTFLSGPLTLRSGVTLLIDANTSLAASVNPRLYDISPGSARFLANMARATDGTQSPASNGDLHWGLKGQSWRSLSLTAGPRAVVDACDIQEILLL